MHPDKGKNVRGADGGGSEPEPWCTHVPDETHGGAAGGKWSATIIPDNEARIDTQNQCRTILSTLLSP